MRSCQPHHNVPSVALAPLTTPPLIGRFRSSEPDARFLFSDRFIAWDHYLGHCYAVALATDNTRAEQEAWLTATSQSMSLLHASFSPASPTATGQARTPSPGQATEPQGEVTGPGSIAFAPLPPSAPTPDSNPGSGPAGHVMNGDDTGLSFRPGRTQGQYEEAVRQCQRHIVDGDSYELCLTSKLTAHVSPDPLRLYSILRKRNKAPYAALLRYGPSSWICCSSPERFLSVSSTGTVESRPIKGTRPRGRSEVEDEEIRAELHGCVKDRAENLMVVDLVRSDLSRVCTPGTVHVPELFSVESYATVHQMVTVVRGQLKEGEGAISAVQHTFPMGSMTGAPKTRTMALLDSIEMAPRGIYSGTLGYFSVSGSADLAVVIRTVQCTPEGLSIGAGGAITILSDPSEEWREMMLKARAVVDATLEACRCAEINSNFSKGWEEEQAGPPPGV